MKRFLATAGVGLAMALGAAGAAQALTVTFDGGVLQGPANGLSGIYTESGLEFDFFGAAPTFISDNHGGHALEIQYNNDILIHPVAGGPFKLDSFFFGGGGDTAWGGFHGDFFSGGENNGQGADVGFILTGLATTVTPFADNPAWGNITVVDWCGYCISGFLPNNAIDDVTFDLPPTATHGGAPEPAGWALMILGVAGVGAALRRRGALA